jgi:hypothetical protein
MNVETTLDLLRVGDGLLQGVTRAASRKQIMKNIILHLKRRVLRPTIKIREIGIPYAIFFKDAEYIARTPQITEAVRTSCGDLCLSIVWIILENEGTLGVSKFVRSLEVLIGLKNNYPIVEFCKELINGGEYQDLKSIARGYEVTPEVYEGLRCQLRRVPQLFEASGAKVAT